jgi:hypothetical protein
MVIILDQVERIDPNEFNLLYDLMEELPERTHLILASKKLILTSEILPKVNTKFLTIENFTEKETEEMLKLGGIPCDENFLRKFYSKYKGYPLLQGMAIKEMKYYQKRTLEYSGSSKKRKTFKCNQNKSLLRTFSFSIF